MKFKNARTSSTCSAVQCGEARFGSFMLQTKLSLVSSHPTTTITTTTTITKHPCLDTYFARSLLKAVEQVEASSALVSIVF